MNESDVPLENVRFPLQVDSPKEVLQVVSSGETIRPDATSQHLGETT